MKWDKNVETSKACNLKLNHFVIFSLVYFRAFFSSNSRKLDFPVWLFLYRPDDDVIVRWSLELNVSTTKLSREGKYALSTVNLRKTTIKYHVPKCSYGLTWACPILVLSFTFIYLSKLLVHLNLAFSCAGLQTRNPWLWTSSELPTITTRKLNTIYYEISS